MDIVEFVKARLDEDEAAAREAFQGKFGEWYVREVVAVGSASKWEVVKSALGWLHPGAFAIRDDAGRDRHLVKHIARHDPARVLAEVKAKRRIVELHTTGSYRTYQCGNGDHIQEWQCERAKEPYTEHRYCEVCGNECEIPLLAAIWSDHPDYEPAWRVE